MAHPSRRQQLFRERVDCEAWVGEVMGLIMGLSDRRQRRKELIPVTPVKDPDLGPTWG
jgi:hypothetical protein